MRFFGVSLLIVAAFLLCYSALPADARAPLNPVNRAYLLAGIGVAGLGASLVFEKRKSC